MDGGAAVSPRISDGKVPVPFRIKPAGRDWLDTLAHKYHLDRSKVIRHALAVARSHEPELKKRLEEDQ